MPCRLCDQLETRGGDRAAIAEVTSDMAGTYSLGCADAMSDAQTVDRFHFMQLLAKGLEQVRCAKAKSCDEEGQSFRGAKYARLKRPENLTEHQAATRASLASEHLPTTRECAMV